MIKTRMTELLGIEYPIMCGGMFLVGRAELAAAVSEAGGLGTITSKTQPTVEDLRKEIQKVKSLTKKPFAVNLNLFPSTTETPNDQYIDVLLEEGVRIVETSGRSPEPIIQRLKDNNVVVIHKVPGARYAASAEKIGVDAVCVVGNETGGHPGMSDVGTLVMVAKATEKVKIPVIAGGGFADGRGLLAALALGAEGIIMGTRFMATKEAPIHPDVKRWMVESDENSTIVIQRAIGSASRVALNNVSRKVDELEKEGATLQELLPYISGQRSKKVYNEGDVNDGGIWSCGQSVGLIHDVPSVKQLIDGIVQEAQQALQRTQQNFGI
ncbi:NAD(P)H-dependent flavin oxidoreductase [Effusibacillus dendaii]|uniref:Probable nitronate monooxygenase n=1 Tax=Effusibacillus dendaii TaxID=2743772 RepID=A0A7I8D971_9BACL|nr:nitronate monooxygenase family protein [Effusibacillus dendaii]BCJ86693.1 nitronate monooxygenase [Effusibacillus dendaii]